MGYYQYKGINTSGRVIKGIVSADSLDLAKMMLDDLKVEPISLGSVKKEQKKRVSSKDFLTFVSDMRILMQAGLPIYDSLITLEEKYRKGRLYLLYSHLATRVKNGDSLSQAVNKYDPSFDPVYLTMLEAGEESGSLEKCFQSLETLIERRQNMSKKIVSSLIYPMFLTAFCFVIAFVLFFYLIPSMKELLLERQVNALTQTVINISDFLVSNQEIVLVFSLTIFALISLFLNHPRGKKGIQKLGMRMPVFSTLLKNAALSRFCLVFGVLLKGGVDFIKALDLSKNVMKNAYFEEMIVRAREGLVQGKKLSEELSTDRLIPPLFIRVVQVGEESGKMDVMMEKLGAIYEDELKKTLFRLISLIQPILLVVLGMIVAIILLSILLPLSDMSAMM